MPKQIYKSALALTFACCIGAASGYLYYQQNFKTHLDTVSREADSLLALTSSYVNLYSKIRSESNLQSTPVPAAFRATANHSFEKNREGDDHFLARMVGLTDRYIATPPTDSAMSATLSMMSQTYDPGMYSVVLEHEGSSVLRTMYPSVATQASCANCHNKIQNPATPWKQGDLMGAYVIERSVQADKLRYFAYAVVTGLLVTLTVLSVLTAIGFYRDLRSRAKELQHLAITDPLTGCVNRRALTEFVEGVSRAERDNAAVLYLDIDHFKQINDTYGHSVGDQVLVWFASKVRSELRQKDVLARVGGEEFTIYLPDISEDMAKGVADRICNAISAEPMSIGTDEFNVTVSIGAVHTSKAPNREFSMYGKAADALLYLAKTNGRNRVMWANEA